MLCVFYKRVSMSLHRFFPFISMSNVCPITITLQSLSSHLFAQTRCVEVNRCLPLFYFPSICPLCIKAQDSLYFFHKFHYHFLILQIIFVFIFFQIISLFTFSVNRNTSEFFCRIMSVDSSLFQIIVQHSHLYRTADIT